MLSMKKVLGVPTQWPQCHSPLIDDWCIILQPEQPRHVVIQINGRHNRLPYASSGTLITEWWWTPDITAEHIYSVFYKLPQDMFANELILNLG